MGRKKPSFLRTVPRHPVTLDCTPAVGMHGGGMRVVDRPLRIYVQADPGNAHTRRLLEGVATYAQRCVPRWRLQWGWDFPEEERLRRAGFHGAVRFEYKPPLDSHGLPTVWVCSVHRAPDAVQVIPDNFSIGRMAAGHFRDRLYKTFAYVSAKGAVFSEERLQGYQRELDGAPVAVHEFIADGDPSAAQKRRLRAFLRSLPRRTAVFAAADRVALHVAIACEEAGILVAEDLALLGVDNDTLLTHASPLPISSIDPSSAELGRRAAMRLEAILKGGSRDAVIERVAPAGVVLRASTDAVATEDVGIAEATRVMRQEACRGLTVDDLCRRLGLGRRSFEQRFVRVLGTTPEAEMRRLRLERAAELLTTTQLPVARVAEEAGFRDAFYFSTAFRKAMGRSPREWRAGDGASGGGRPME